MATTASELDLTLGGPDALGVLETTAPVAAAARSVRIRPEAIARVAGALAGRPLPVPNWDKRYHWTDGAGRTVNVLLLLDALNFSFWPEPGAERWELEYGGERLDGYWALAAALKRAIEEEDCPLWDADFLSDIDEDDANCIFHPEGKSAGRIPMFKTRLANMREVGRVLGRKYDGWFGAAIEAAGGSAQVVG